MRVERLLLLLGLIAAAEAARQSRDSHEDNDSSEVDESDADWERRACGVYETCLQEYDDRMIDCGHGKDNQLDDDDSCYEPIEKYFHALVDKKEQRNQALRKCYNTGSVDKSKNEKKTKKENSTSGHFVGKVALNKRHRSSCKQKFGELEQFMFGKKRRNGNGNGGTKHPAAQPMGAESCHASAKRLKERCRKIESCCSRVKSCRAQIAGHSISEDMRELEKKIREGRRNCMEKEHR